MGIIMAGKAKPTKHSAKEIAMKHHEAKMKKGGRGGGAEGIEKRGKPKDGKKDVMMNCTICFTAQPSVKSMKIHYDSKHPKVNWETEVLKYDKSLVEEKVEEENKYNQYNQYEYNEEEEEEKEVEN